MRLSVRENDPGYDPNIFLMDIKVSLDGEPVSNVITADEEKGYILAYAENEDGEYIMNYEEDDPDKPYLKTIELNGKVEIKIKAT